MLRIQKNRMYIKGFTLLEMTLATLVAGILMMGMDGLLNTALQANRNISGQNDALQQARFAMQQMVRAVAGTQRLMIPLGENPATVWSESVRDVLAVTLDPTIDRDNDGWADANNDKDFLDINNNGSRDEGEPERIDEDVYFNNTNNFRSGIVDIDDNGDGISDNSIAATAHHDNDEDGVSGEDPLNGIDDDNDGTIDEDFNEDMNGDGKPGIAGVDDDFDGKIDEGLPGDDDEDGVRNEEWFDTVVFFVDGTDLMQRIPNINSVDGNDYSEYVIADHVTQLLVKRILGDDGISLLVDITLKTESANSELIQLNTQVRVGGSL